MKYPLIYPVYGIHGCLASVAEVYLVIAGHTDYVLKQVGKTGESAYLINN